MLAERLGWHSSGTLDPVSGASIHTNNGLKFQIQKSPVIADEASLYWRSGWAGIPAGLSTPCLMHQYIPTTGLNFRYKKAPSFLTRLRCIGGAAGLAFHWAGTPAGLSTPCLMHQYIPTTGLNSRYKKASSFLTRLRCIGGADGTRTRDPRRDRPVF